MNKEGDELGVPGVGGKMQRRVSLRRSTRVHRTAALHQELYDAGVPSRPGGINGKVILVVVRDGGEVGSRIKQKLCNLEMPEKRRQVQRRPTVVRSLIHEVGVFAQELLDFCLQARRTRLEEIRTHAGLKNLLKDRLLIKIN